MKRGGFSLLEVALALAILGGAIAVLGEANRLALRSASAARDLAHAQLLCESVLAEVVSGVIPAESVDQTPFDESTTDSLDPNEPQWVYTIETNETDEPGLISVRVMVTRDMPVAQHPVQFSLTRWVPDPNYTSPTAAASQNAQQSGGASNNSGS
jgi:general secretion pathway protein I